MNKNRLKELEALLVADLEMDAADHALYNAGRCGVKEKMKRFRRWTDAKENRRLLLEHMKGETK